MITPTGGGLNIIINCEFTLLHEWMTFASWYSILKNLPDANVEIICRRTNYFGSIFRWPARANVVFTSVNEFPVLEKDKFQITPEVMAVRTFNSELIGPVSAKSDLDATFVNYSEGCGNFVMSEWIDIMRNPFSIVDKLNSNYSTVNEKRILKLWEKCNKTYNVMA